MNESSKSLTTKILSRLSTKDFLGLIIFLLIPLTFFVSNFITLFRIYYYAILAVFIAGYTLINQFFFEKERLSSLGKRLVAITIINTIIISFIQLTGGLTSPYFFVLYFLIFSVAILSPVFILILECLIIFTSIFVTEAYQFSSIAVMFRSLDSYQTTLLFSIIAAIPITAAISKFVKDLQTKDQLLRISMNLLEIENIEDEALLSEIDQGVIILDPNLKIIKVSKWIEKNFSITSQVLLGKRITDISFYDAVTNKRFPPNSFFYKNLLSSTPKALNWRVLYKSQYGKFKKFVIKQTPLIVNNQIKGFLLSVNLPPTTVQEIINTFNQLLIFRLSSSIGMVKNLVMSSETIRRDPAYPLISKHIGLITGILTDTSTRNSIVEGTIEVRITQFDLKVLLERTIHNLSKVGKISLWHITPLYKTKPMLVKSDSSLCEKLFNYSILSALYLAKDSSISLSIDQDEVSKRARIAIVSDLKVKCPEDAPITEPFFEGKLIILSKYAGTGLELSNANLIAQFLAFDFNTGISNNKLVINITF